MPRAHKSGESLFQSVDATDMDRSLEARARARAAFLAGETTIGPWRLDPRVLVLVHEERRYEVDVEREGSAAVLDFIVQVGKKAWCTREALGQLVEALDLVLDLQANYRSGGVDHQAKWRAKLRLLRKGRRR